MVCYRRIIYFHVTFIKQKGLPDSPVRVCAMTLECARIDGINLAQGVCDTEALLPVRSGAHEPIARKMLEYNKISADPESGYNR